MTDQNAEYQLGTDWELEVTLEDADGASLKPAEVEVTWTVSDERFRPLVTASSTVANQHDVPDPNGSKIIMVIARDRQGSVRPDQLCEQRVTIRVLADDRVSIPVQGTLYARRSM